MNNPVNPGQPNFVIVMADQLTAPAVGAYGNSVALTPYIDRLAQQGVLFENAYCNSPLCAPARFSMMSGQLPSHIGAYDNASEFPARIPTFAHYLRDLGYQTCLSGKMHFIGPDQLHGFEERLTTDIYPADFGWTPDWEAKDQRVDWWCHNLSSVTQAGIAETTNQLEFDDEVGHQTIQKIYQLARRGDKRPFLLTASFTHPHDPYAARKAYWDRYNKDAIDLPNVPAMTYGDLDPHSQRIHDLCAMGETEINQEDIRNARHAYYASTSYIDDWLGRIVGTLEDSGLMENTVVIFISDHGDMLGERGLWYKMVFFEGAMRIPMIISAPGRFRANRISNNVSLLDLLPTLVELASPQDAAVEYADHIDGRSLVPLLSGDFSGDCDEAVGEMLCEGAIAPCMMIKRGRYKFIHSDPDPDQLFDVIKDPNELHNLSGMSDVADLERGFVDEIESRWNSTVLREEVIADQKRRRKVFGSLSKGVHTSWDHHYAQDAAQKFMRNNMDLNVLERETRYPPPREK